MHIRRVFEKPREEKLINLKKCSFVKRELVYLGFFVSAKGLKMDPKKVKAIVEWPTPMSAIEVRSFHSLENFYRNFIKGFNNICAALTEIMRGDRKEFKWTVGARKIFDVLKKKVIEQLVLALPNFKKVFQVDCDASGNAIGVVLSQEGRHVSYFSENLNNAKKKYFFYDQEFNAIVQALKKWRHYFLPKEFVLFMDHQSLQYLNSPGKLNQRNLKWVKFLQNYTFLLKHRSGRSNKVVDALSRRQNLLTEMQIEVVGFNELKNLYPKDLDFVEAWRACKEPITLDRRRWLDFTIQDDMLF
jgi:RNase H-fold protein (predicted Holliday junction resolvase)